MSARRTPKIVKPPLLPIFGRVLSLFAALAVCAAIACTSWARGISWIYDAGNGGNLVVLTCPDQIYSFTGTVPEGDFCQLSIRRDQDFLDYVALNGLFDQPGGFNCIRPTNNEDPIICNLDQVCGAVCQMKGDGSVCKSDSELGPQPVGEAEPQCTVGLGFNPDGNMVTADVDCRKVLYGSYCDSNFKVTSSNTLAMRGIFAGIGFLTLLWLIAEFILRSVDIDLRREKAIGMARMAEELPEKRAILRKSLEERWRQEAIGRSNSFGDFESDNMSQVGTPWSSSPSPRSMDVTASAPSRRFTSASWRRRIHQWKKLRSEKTSSFQAKVFLRTLLLNLFFVVLLIGTFYVVISISPQNISTLESWDLSTLGKVKVYRMDSWIDYLIFADVLVDTGLFLIAIIAVKWPKAPVFSRHIQEQIAQVTDKEVEKDDGSIGLDYSISDRDSSICTSGGSVSFILDQAMSGDTCLMIACHCSTMTIERCETFSNTLRSALAVFPPHHIFVCDNGPTIHPQDETQFIAKQVNPLINYVYIPEGNKTFAFYWTNKHWIPFLAKCGVVPNFTYAVIIDDDVPLPSDLHIPHEHLKKDSNIKAVHFPITATTPDGKPPVLVRCQDIEYKLAAVHKLFQASLSRALSCHGAIALWDREAMGEVFQEHDTVFNGEDLYMGLCLLRKRDSSTIISCAQTIVPTYAPDTWAVLFRQRVKSWELTSHKKSFTFLVEIINPVSFCHVASLCLKPYFIQELLTVLLDWLRVFLLMGLLLRDTLGLLLMTMFFTGVQYFQLSLFQFVVLRDRKDLRSSFFTVLMFPLYKLCNLFFRVCALCQNILVYSHERKGIKISVREDEIRDVPPLPPHYLVDWFTIWEEPEAPVDGLTRKKAAHSVHTPNRFRM
jgi:hypothetical protein